MKGNKERFGLIVVTKNISWGRYKKFGYVIKASKEQLNLELLQEVFNKLISHNHEPLLNGTVFYYLAQGISNTSRGERVVIIRDIQIPKNVLPMPTVVTLGIESNFDILMTYDIVHK